jgi:peptidoglycan-associated lipoprotein
MKKMFKGFLAGLVVITSVAVPACRPKVKVVPKNDTANTQSSVPDVAVTVTTATETKVDTQPPDFVQDTPKVTVESLPTNVEELNRTVQEKGYLRDPFFGYDEAALSADGQAALQSSATWLKQNSTYGILIEGHCDERGTEQYNLALGDRRASIVRDYLVTLGVESARIRTVSYGEERPFDPGHAESAWATNRRAHLGLTGTR